MNLEQFTAPADVAYATVESRELGYNVWRLMEGFRFYPNPNDTTTYVDVPKGFLTDGASVPLAFWCILPPWGSYGQAAIVHDYLCTTGKMTLSGVDGVLSQRAVIDETFKKAMVALGVPSWKKNVMYICVRIYAKVVRPSIPDADPRLMALVNQWNSSSSGTASGASV